MYVCMLADWSPALYERTHGLLAGWLGEKKAVDKERTRERNDSEP